MTNMQTTDNTVALIPYFGGDETAPGTAANSRRANRLGYLQQTIDSVYKLTPRIIVGVSTADPSSTPFELGCVVQIFDCEPRFIPATLARWAQAELSNVSYVYFTEADQILSFNHDCFTVIDNDTYLAPHRIERLGQLGEGASRGMVVKYAGDKWLLPNGVPWGPDFYHPVGLVDQYGGAFLATWNLFSRVVFQDSYHSPVEHVSGFYISSTGHTLKTSNWRDFFVDHLSGYEFHESLGGR